MSMLGHYARTAMRSARRDSTGFFINLLGLITGFVVFTFAFAFADYEEHYDNFFENAERIYIPSIGVRPDAPFDRSIFYSYFTGVSEVANAMNEKVDAATVVVSSTVPIKHQNEYFEERARFTDAKFFEMFNLTFVDGSIEAFGTNPNGIIISRSTALKFFGEQSAIGQTLLFDEDNLMEVIAVFEDLPLNSHFTSSYTDSPRFNVLAPITYWEKRSGEKVNEDWSNVSTSRLTYIMAKKGISRADLEEGLTAESIKHLQDFSLAIFGKTVLRNIQEWNLNYWDQRELDGPFLARMTGMVLLAIAVLNSISLNSVRMLGRSQEIGLRRIMGASRGNLTGQFLSENIFLSLLALAVALVLTYFLTPIIGNVMDRTMDFSLMLTLPLILTLLACALLVGVLSASYPIALLTGMASGMALTRTLRVGNSSGVMRKVMTTAQFAVVTALLFAVITVHQQNQLILNSAPEISSNQLYAIEGLGRAGHEKVKLIRDELIKRPDIADISLTNQTQFSSNTSISFFASRDWSIKDLTFQVIAADDHYLPLYNIPLLAGRNFDGSREDDILRVGEGEGDNRPDLKVIVNELVLQKLGLGSPQEAIGKTFMQGGSERPSEGNVQTIIGVIPTMRFGVQGEGTYPQVLSYAERNLYQMAILFKDGGIPDFKGIEDTIKQLVPGVFPNIRSTVEMRDAAFKTNNQVQQGFMIIAAIAVILAGTGLYALAHFMARGKRREVGLRKVLGAQTPQILRILFVQFSAPIIIALALGVPTGFWGMSNYLEAFPERVELGSETVFLTIALTLVVAWVTMIYQIIRAARTHPAEVLRYE